MLKAYDTLLQSEVLADLAARSGSFETYRYECACCGEEVRIAAVNSISMVPHFRHLSGNNYIECENYLGQYGALNIGSHSRKSKRERAEFYFEKGNKTFNLGLCFSKEEINFYQKEKATFELSSSGTGQAFTNLLINNMKFSPDFPTMIPIKKFSLNYYLSNTLDDVKRKYKFFKLNNIPNFFKILGNDKDLDFKAKLVRSSFLYTNTYYFVTFQSKNSVLEKIRSIKEIHADETFSFETMGTQFTGVVLKILKKTPTVDSLMLEWQYTLESSETLTLLWPPAAMIEDVSVISSDYAFLYSSFELQPHGNINVQSRSIKQVDNNVCKVSVESKTKVFKKNVEIVLDKEEQEDSIFDKISVTENVANAYTVPDDCSCFLFNSLGIQPLGIGQTVWLTPKSEIRQYHFGYLTGRIVPKIRDGLTGRYLLDDILAHYKQNEVFDTSLFSSCDLSQTASLYLEECKTSGSINTGAKYFIEKGQL